MSAIPAGSQSPRSGRIHDWDPKTSASKASVARGFSADFRAFLAENDASGLAFADPSRPALGGRGYPGEPIRRTPVILIHGNSDTADGFAPVIEELRRRGYRDCEIYALSWGRNAPELASLEHHSANYLREIRRFKELVLEYTGCDRVQVLAHSMGVTASLVALSGGEGRDARWRRWSLGPSLLPRIDTFIGVAGALGGLEIARGFGALPGATSIVSGFHPNSKILGGLQAGLAQAMSTLPPADRPTLVSVVGDHDEVLGKQFLETSALPAQRAQYVLPGVGHLEALDATELLGGLLAPKPLERARRVARRLLTPRDVPIIWNP